MRIISPTSAMDLIRFRVMVFFLFINKFLQIQTGSHRTAAGWAALFFLHSLRESKLAQNADHFTVVSHRLCKVLANIPFLHNNSSLFHNMRRMRCIHCRTGSPLFLFAPQSAAIYPKPAMRSPLRCGYYSTGKGGGVVVKLTSKWEILTSVNQK